MTAGTSAKPPTAPLVEGTSAAATGTPTEPTTALFVEETPTADEDEVEDEGKNEDDVIGEDEIEDGRGYPRDEDEEAIFKNNLKIKFSN